jgi:hypothetical protein
MVVPTRSQEQPIYDPWKDINDDGKLDILDIVLITGQYAASGTPIDKTALLLELEDRIENLNASLTELRSQLEEIEKRTLSKKGVLAIAGSEFTPDSDDSLPYFRGIPMEGKGGYFAVLHLPTGATLTNLTADLCDAQSNGAVSVLLLGFNTTSGELLTYPMAAVYTTLSETPGEVVLHDDMIANAKVDMNCLYILAASISYYSQLLSIKYVKIEYEYLP